MYIPQELKLNRFQQVNIPENRSYFTPFGYNNMNPGSYTGEELAPVAKNKVDTFADMEEFDRVRQREETTSE